MESQPAHCYVLTRLGAAGCLCGQLRAAAQRAKTRVMLKKKKGRRQRRPFAIRVVQPSALPHHRWRRCGCAASDAQERKHRGQRESQFLHVSLFPCDAGDRRDDGRGSLVHESHTAKPICGAASDRNASFGELFASGSQDRQKYNGCQAVRSPAAGVSRRVANMPHWAKIRTVAPKNCPRPARMFTASFRKALQMAAAWRIAHTVASIVQGVASAV